MFEKKKNDRKKFLYVKIIFVRFFCLKTVNGIFVIFKIFFFVVMEIKWNIFYV